jgi:hypothetical protein
VAEADIINKSYEALVDQAFNAYWNNAFIGNPSASQIQQAETSFRNEILAARKARDRAIALLPP